MAKIVKADDVSKTKKTTTKSSGGSKIDLGKIKNIIDDNPEAVKKIKDGVTDLLASQVVSKATKKKTTKKTTKTSKKSSGTDLSKMLDLAGTFLKK